MRHIKGSTEIEIVFTKLASQLTADKLVDLAIIPIIFAVQTLVSYLCSMIVSKAFGFSKRPRNFVIAMGVGFTRPCEQQDVNALIGIWQFQFPPYLSGVILVSNNKGIALG